MESADRTGVPSPDPHRRRSDASDASDQSDATSAPQQPKFTVQHAFNHERPDGSSVFITTATARELDDVDAETIDRYVRAGWISPTAPPAE